MASPRFSSSPRLSRPSCELRTRPLVSATCMAVSPFEFW
jgi:hypothetical protein